MKYIIMLIMCLSLGTSAQVVKHPAPKRAPVGWTPNPKYVTTPLTKLKYQCMGTTKQGNRCKKGVQSEGEYCKMHQYQK